MSDLWRAILHARADLQHSAIAVPAIAARLRVPEAAVAAEWERGCVIFGGDPTALEGYRAALSDLRDREREAEALHAEGEMDRAVYAALRRDLGKERQALLALASKALPDPVPTPPSTEAAQAAIAARYGH